MQNYNSKFKIKTPKSRISKIKNLASRIQNPVSGFSLVEMIIVLFIISIISTITLANYRSGQRINDLITETQKIISVFKQAQNMALSGYVTTGTRTDCGYGVKIDSPTSATTYRLFIDKAPCDYQYNGGDETIQTFSLTSGLTIAGTYTNLVFEPPLGDVYGNGTLIGANTPTYTIEQAAASRILYIRVNSNGQINVISSQ